MKQRNREIVLQKDAENTMFKHVSNEEVLTKMVTQSTLKISETHEEESGLRKFNTRHIEDTREGID